MCRSVFCFKQKTAYGMRIRDWSSESVSSDLADPAAQDRGVPPERRRRPRNDDSRIVRRGQGQQPTRADAARIAGEFPLPNRRGDVDVPDSADRGRARHTAQKIDLVARRLPVDRAARHPAQDQPLRSEEHTSELQSLMRNSYAVFCLKKKTKTQ